MNTQAKNLSISTAIGIVAYFAIGLAQHEEFHVPTTINDYIALVIILAAVIASSLIHTGANVDAESDEETGTVKWFNVKKGYGFITRDQGDDVFVHYRNIQGQGRRAISEGQRVRFVVITGDKGLQADEVEAL
ncbi:MAG: cold shock domain-containing protein [Pseudomonadales bacterium]|nr:cold shock domain-containing protein [Pseudomonadales bacterium]